jgi:xylulokinase
MWLGLDIGTSGVKAVISDDGSTVVAEATAPLTVSRPQPLWSEQDPEDWWTAVTAAVTSLPASARSAVRGVGLAGQMHGAVLLDADDRVLRPAILWNDGRAAAECAALGAAERVTGNLAMPGFTAPKLLWLRDHEPQIFARVAKVLLPKDWVRLRLTGDHATDMSDASGTFWLDVGQRRWSDEMLTACGMVAAHMPTAFEGTAMTGMLRSNVAAKLGLPVVPVAAGGGDNAAGAVGVGVVAPGDAFLSLGTSGVLFAVSDGFRPNPAEAVHAFCHALPGIWHQMAVILSAAASVDWATRLVGFPDVGAAVAAAEAADDRAVPLFLPYLSGERTPHNDAQATGVLFGLTHDSDAASVVRAVLEGVAFALADGADALRAAGTRLNALTVIGGGSRSRFWGGILAAALGCRLDYVAGGDVGPAYGAARLARIAVTAEAVADVCTKPLVAFSIAPDEALVARLAPRRERFRRLYPALRESFRA